MDRQELPLKRTQSQLFTIRLWVEELGNGQEEIRMQVKHIRSGETRYFRMWSLRVAYLRTKTQAVDKPY